MGNLNEAEKYLKEAIDLLKVVPDYLALCGASTDLAKCYLKLGRVKEALEILKKNELMISKKGLKGWVVTLSCITFAEAYLSEIETFEKPYSSNIIKKAKIACKKAMRKSKCFKYGLPSAYRLQGTYYFLKGKRKAANEWWHRSLDTANDLGAKHEEGLTCLEIGKRMRDFSSLKHAETIFSEIGAKLDLNQTLELLGKRGNGF